MPMRRLFAMKLHVASLLLAFLVISITWSVPSLWAQEPASEIAPEQSHTLLLPLLSGNAQQAGEFAARNAPQNAQPLYLQLPFESGQTALATGGFGPNSNSEHSPDGGGALDFQLDPIAWGADTSQHWVVAAARGQVTYKDESCVELKHGDLFTTFYLHLDNVIVAEGDWVNTNQRLGTIATTKADAERCSRGGVADGPHLHFQVRPNTEGIYLSGYQVRYDRAKEITTFTRGDKVIGVNRDELTSIYQPFWDVPPGSAFAGAIVSLASRDLSSGYEDGSYQPDKPITRGEVAKLLVRAIGNVVNDETGASLFLKPWSEPLFPDLPQNHPYYWHIRLLANKAGDPEGERIARAIGDVQVLTSKADGNFHPDDPVTRAELATMIGLLLEGKDIPCVDDTSPFKDVPEGSAHERYITCLKVKGYVDNYPDGEFKPNNFVTRAEAAKLLAPLIDLTTTQPAASMADHQAGVVSATQAGELSIECDAIPLGVLHRLSTPGYNGDSECFTLPVVAAGSSYLFSIIEPALNARTEIAILDADGNQVAFRRHNERRGPVSWTWTAPSASLYQVRLTNADLFAREGVEYSFQVDTLNGTREYRAELEGGGLCGPDGQIQLEVDPRNADEIELEVRRCDGRRFSEGGNYWVLVDGNAAWGPFDFARNASSFRLTVRPAEQGILGRHTYQIMVHPSGDPTRAMRTGAIRIWDFFPGRVGSPQDVDYNYSVASPNTHCEGSIELRLTTSRHRLAARVRKCNRTAFNSSGELWILADGVKRWGPIPFTRGTSSINVYLDAKGGYDIQTPEVYEAWIYSNCDLGTFNCNPDEAINGGQVSASPQLQTEIVARLNGAVWNQVGIWRESPNGMPLAQGQFVDYLTNETGEVDFFLNKRPGYTLDELLYESGLRISETNTHYVVRMTPGTRAHLDYVLDCRRLQTLATPADGGIVKVETPPNCGASMYLSGTVVNLVAHPAEAHAFGQWEGHADGIDLATTVTMNHDRSVVAEFVPPCYVLSDLSTTGGGHLVVLTPPNCGSDSYALGTEVMLQAVPEPGYFLSGWSESVLGGGTTIKVLMNQSRSIAAQFAPLPRCYALTLKQTEGGKLTARTAPNCDGNLFAEGTEVKIEATVNTGYDFMGWSDNSLGSQRTVTIVMDRDRTLSARFMKGPVGQTKKSLFLPSLQSSGE